MPQHSKATSIFLDLYKLSPARPDRKLLGGIAGGFAELPWENLTKFIKKHRLEPTEEEEVAHRVHGLAGVEKLRLATKFSETTRARGPEVRAFP